MLDAIIPIFILMLGAVIMFLAGAVYATPKDDPNVVIEYLKDRIKLLEHREHLRAIEDRELIMELMHGDKNKEGVTDKDKDKKMPVQTKWVS